MARKIVRRPDRAEGGVTSDELALMEKHSKLWISRALRTEPIDKDKITRAIHGIYQAAGLKLPRVVIVPSPLVMAFAYGAAAAIWHVRKTSKGRAEHAVTDIATRAAARSATRDIVGQAGAAEAAAMACYESAGDLGISCARNWQSSYQGGNFWAPWESYVTGARDILKLELPEHEKYAPWEQAAIHGGFRVMHEEFCLVCDFPEFIHIDDQNRPHCATGPSHRWRDGWSLYHWHGTSIPSEWIDNPKALTAKIAIGQENLELRRSAIEILGWAKVLKELDAKVIDQDNDPECGTLLEVNLPDLRTPSRFLRVLCGTRREFAIGVPNECATALQAQAWIAGMDKDFELPLKRT